MPVTRSNKTSTRAGKSYSRSTSNPSKKSFGPISAQDIEIAAFSGVCDARKFNESRITAALHDLVPCPPKQAWIKATDNMRVSRPKLSTGKTGGALGRWLQVCFKKKGEVYSEPITPILDADTIACAGNLSVWLKIREEIQAKPRKISTPSKNNPSPSRSISSQTKPPSEKPSPSHNASSFVNRPTPFPLLSPISESSSVPPLSPPIALSPVHDFLIDGLDLDVPVLLIIWLEDGEEPVEFIAYPRIKDGRLRLGDFKVALGNLGLEVYNDIEIYIQDQDWLTLWWSTSLEVNGTDRFFFIRDATVGTLLRFEEIQEAYYPPTTGKGKRRM